MLLLLLSIALSPHPSNEATSTNRIQAATDVPPSPPIIVQAPMMTTGHVCCGGYSGTNPEGQNSEGTEPAGTNEGGTNAAGTDAAGTNEGGTAPSGTGLEPVDESEPGAPNATTKVPDFGGMTKVPDFGGTKPEGAEPEGKDPEGTNEGGTAPSGTCECSLESGGTNPGGKNPGGTKPGGTKPGGTKPWKQFRAECCSEPADCAAIAACCSKSGDCATACETADIECAAKRALGDCAEVCAKGSPDQHHPCCT